MIEEIPRKLDNVVECKVFQEYLGNVYKSLATGLALRHPGQLEKGKEAEGHTECWDVPLAHQQVVYRRGALQHPATTAALHPLSPPELVPTQFKNTLAPC